MKNVRLSPWLDPQLLNSCRACKFASATQRRQGGGLLVLIVPVKRISGIALGPLAARFSAHTVFLLASFAVGALPTTASCAVGALPSVASCAVGAFFVTASCAVGAFFVTASCAVGALSSTG